MTTDPAPITVLFFMFTGKIVALDPILTLFDILVCKKFSGFLFSFLSVNLSFIKLTPCPIKQLSPIFTFSQINVWL